MCCKISPALRNASEDGGGLDDDPTPRGTELLGREMRVGLDAHSPGSRTHRRLLGSAESGRNLDL
jgi:hypothetical protein